MSQHNLNENITLLTRNKFFEDEYINSIKIIKEALIIKINIKGNSRYESLICSHQIQSEEGETIIDLLKPDEGVAKIDKNTYQKSLGFIISKKFLQDNIPLDKYTDNLHHSFEYEKNIKNLSHKKTNPKTQALALDILNTPYKDTLDKLYIEAKSLELLHTELNNFLADNLYTSSHIKFSKQDKEAIYYAKELMMNNISNPPSLQELSYKVKINQTKLKYGFKRFFNQTPYSTSLESRLQEAKKLLESSEYNISEIALQVGYKYTQSFSNAFYKRFKIRPKDLMKSRTYYY